MGAEGGSILQGQNPLTMSPMSLFLMQCCVVIVTARILSFPLKWLRQPTVIAEVIGGLVLGASCLCRIPAFKNNLFPASSLPFMKIVADLGLVFYMFLVGLELEPIELFKTFKKSVAISVAGIVLPFGLGLAIARLIYDTYADQTVPFTSFLLFIGVAMSITAFPVLARILTERKLMHTRVGQATISAAACDDFIAWTLLVLVVALVNNGGNGKSGSYTVAVYVFLVVIGYTLFLWFAVRPILAHLVNLAKDREHVHHLLLFVVFTIVLFSSWFTEVIGVQAIFGAFLVGIVIPHDHGFARKLAGQFEDLVTVVFLPLYFAYSGLNTQLGLLDDGKSWSMVALICFIACLGKMLGCTIAARGSGLNWREASAVGILMNTRGLVQIIVLNVGLTAGVITPKLFAIFVLMALFTTFMTVPLITLVYPHSYYSKEVSLGPKDSVVDKPDDHDVVDAMSSPNQSETEIRALVCLPSMEVVSSMMTLCTMISGSQYIQSFTVFALRLVKMDQRFTTVMKAANPTDTIEEDPVLNVFHTFSGLHGVSSHPLLDFADPGNLSNAVAEAAKQSSVNLVIIPQAATKKTEAKVESSQTTSQSKNQSGWIIGDDSTQRTRAMASEVSKAIPSATVVHFIDRGFMALNPSRGSTPSSRLFSVFARTGSASTLDTSKAFTPEPINVSILVAGLSDSSENEAMLFVKHITSSLNVSPSIKFRIHIVKLPAPADSSAVTLESVPLLAAPSIKNAADVMLETDNIPALTSCLGNLCRNQEDLIVVGESVVQRNSDYFASGHKEPGLEHWLAYTSVASVAIVRGHK